MKILESSSSDNRYTADLNEIRKIAHLGGGLGYPLISGSTLVSLLEALIGRVADDDRADKLNDLDERRIQKYADMFAAIFEAADTLRNQAAALHEASKLAKTLIARIKSDIEKANDTYIKFKED